MYIGTRHISTLYLCMHARTSQIPLGDDVRFPEDINATKHRARPTDPSDPNQSGVTGVPLGITATTMVFEYNLRFLVHERMRACMYSLYNSYAGIRACLYECMYSGISMHECIYV